MRIQYSAPKIPSLSTSIRKIRRNEGMNTPEASWDAC